jgi:uncharacterized damage-inducible protein DinB
MADETLLMLLRDVRGTTIRLLEGLNDGQARFAPKGLANSILWHAGHAYVLQEHLGIKAAGQPAVYPEGWFEAFSWKSAPATVTHWPAATDVLRHLSAQRDRLSRIIEQLTDEQLSHVTNPARGTTLRYSIMHGLHDEANHQGEMYLLRKLLRAAGQLQ